MNYWLMKSEPDVFSYDDLVKKGREHWDGVRNYAARNNLRAMKKGDLAFFYHSNTDKAIVGIMEIVKEAYQDPTTKEEAWVCVDVAPKEKLSKMVSLIDVKANPKLAGMELLRLGRLSVQVVTKKEWDEVLKMSKK